MRHSYRYYARPNVGDLVPSTWCGEIDGLCELKRRDVGTWHRWPKSQENSKKPDAFLDLVESVSFGPYLEMFARRNRLGWDTWGNEALPHIDYTSVGVAA